jgi:ribosomal-protein-alanine N-acetyltransferase
MNAAVLRPFADDEATLHPLSIAMLDELLPIERAAYEFPWTRANFVDSIAAGYWSEALIGEREQAMRAYFVAMPGIDEMHLLNLTVAPAWQRRGIASSLLDELVRRCRRRRARQLWLEVRASNVGARALYERYGFRHIGIRKGYYPAAGGRREDALVMGFNVDGVV